MVRYMNLKVVKNVAKGLILVALFLIREKVKFVNATKEEMFINTLDGQSLKAANVLDEECKEEE